MIRNPYYDLNLLTKRFLTTACMAHTVMVRVTEVLSLGFLTAEGTIASNLLRHTWERLTATILDWETCQSKKSREK